MAHAHRAAGAAIVVREARALDYAALSTALGLADDSLQLGAVPTQLAREAFYATGTLLAKCDGAWCTDGGVTAMCPLFEDRRREQLVVCPTKSGLPLSTAVKYSLAQAVAAVEKGQDDMAGFLASAAVAGGAQQPADPDAPSHPARSIPSGAIALVDKVL